MKPNSELAETECPLGPVKDSARITGYPEATEFDALSKIYAEKPDLEAGERFLRQSVRLDPLGFFVDIELGNLYLKRGSRENALQAYSDALQHAPNDPELRRSIEEQIKRVSAAPLGQVPELRNPFME